jgi:hypothetical protein
VYQAGEKVRPGCVGDPLKQRVGVRSGRIDGHAELFGQHDHRGPLRGERRRAIRVFAEEAGGLIKPFVFVVPRDPGVDPEALRADLRRFLDGALAPHQRPREIRIVSELPRTATGKLQRFRLRDLAQENA